MQQSSPFGVFSGKALAILLAATIHFPAFASPEYRLQGNELVQVAEVPAAKMRVAVVDFRAIGAPAAFGDAVAENLRNALVAQQRYTVVERTQIQQALKEQHFGQTGLVDAKQAVALGKLLGAKMIIVGSVTKIGSTYTVNARFIDVQTGEATDARSLKTTNEDEIAQVVDQLATDLGGRTGNAAAAAASRTGTGKSKLLATGLSVVLPGVGQFYNGNIGMGIAELVVNLAGFGIATYGRVSPQDTTNAALFYGGLATMGAATLWSGIDAWVGTAE